jgi:murein DD-endopeptidase MepM/ murein hydrolase activator NlpD
MPRLPLRQLLISVVVLLVVVAPAAADLGGRKHAVDDRIASLHDRIDTAHAREQTLTAEINSVTTRIRSLEAQVGDVSSRLTTLQNDLDLHQTRLAKIQSLYQLQTQQLRFLKSQYATAVERLNERLVAIYQSDDPTTIDVLLSARSISDMIDQIDYMNAVASRDKEITTQVGSARRQMRQARVRTAKMQTTVAAETKVIAYRTSQQAALRDGLLISRNALSGARDAKQRDLTTVGDQERAWTNEANALNGVSAQLATQIEAAQSAPAAPSDGSGASSGSPSSSGTPASSGLIWPVSGPITSPFGMRWGSLHPGLDIGAGMGTPIKAAAAGRVIISGYNGGYGNLVVIDHGNGLATAYAHQSQIAVSVGQQVGQGQVIGYVGSTGFSTGPHLHFEVRVNGSAVDPMGYL